MIYRPWGNLESMLSMNPSKSWHLLGCLGTEQRSLTAWSYLKSLGMLKGESLLQIFDVDSEKYRDRNSTAYENRIREFTNLGGSEDSISKFELVDEQFRIKSFINSPENLSESIVLDISSLPKKFFFILLKNLVNNDRVQNLLVTYTSPNSYANDDPLYEDIQSWQCLPGFGWIDDRKEPENWIVSVGFLVESLRLTLIENPPNQVKILVPFPSPLSVLRRTRKSVAELEMGLSNTKALEKYSVDTLDMSSGFNRIANIADKNNQRITFAPFGPKPTAAAMCLYAMQRPRSTAVLYPQPTIYHPDYSIGIRNDSKEEAVNAYWIKYDNEFLYSI